MSKKLHKVIVSLCFATHINFVLFSLGAKSS